MPKAWFNYNGIETLFLKKQIETYYVCYPHKFKIDNSLAIYKIIRLQFVGNFYQCGVLC